MGGLLCVEDDLRRLIIVVKAAQWPLSSVGGLWPFVRVRLTRRSTHTARCTRMLCDILPSEEALDRGGDLVAGWAGTGLDEHVVRMLEGARAAGAVARASGVLRLAYEPAACACCAPVATLAMFVMGRAREVVTILVFCLV
jgi:hypothetical protein